MQSIKSSFLVIILLSLLVLPSCRASETKIVLTVTQIEEALNGKNQLVVFSASIDALLDLNDIEQKQQLQNIKTILSNYLLIDDINITRSDFGAKISVDGQLPLILNGIKRKEEINKRSAYAVTIDEIDKKNAGIFRSFDYRIRFSTTPYFSSMNDEMTKMDMFLEIDKTQPVRFLVNNKKQKTLVVFSGPTEYDGEYLQYLQLCTSKDKFSLTMKEGIYETIQPNFYFKISDKKYPEIIIKQ